MDIKELLGADYRDGMTIDEINTALANKSFVDKKTFDATASQLAKEKRDGKAANDGFAEQLKAANDKIRELTVGANKQTAARILSEAGLASSDYESFLDGIATEDVDTTSKLATEIAKMVKARETAVEQRLKTQQIDHSPKPEGGKAPEVTKEVFEKMSITEKMKLKTENPTIFNNLIGGKN